jgi:hypothetical protein
MEKIKKEKKKEEGGMVLAEIYTGERWFKRKKREENRWKQED